MENTRNAYQLSILADCSTPTNSESAGARFLMGVADAFYDGLDDLREEAEPQDLFYEWAEPSVYTQEMWEQFVDIATQEDPEIEGTMEQMASYALVKVGERLLWALWEEAQERTCEDCKGDLSADEMIVCTDCGAERDRQEREAAEANIRDDEAQVAGDPSL